MSTFFTDEVVNLINEDQKLIAARGWGNLIVPKSAYKDMPALQLDQNAMYVAQKLRDAGFTSYLVGGTLRDYILGKPALDFDFATDATYDQCREVFGDDFLLHWVGSRAFGGVMVNGVHVDVGTYSDIPAEYVGKPRMPKDASKTLLNESYERDLTFNAMYYDPFSQEIIDFHGGLYDLMTRRVNCVGIANIQHRYNPVRIIRNLRFAAKYDFSLSPETEEDIRLNGRNHLRNFAPNVFTYNVTKCFDEGCAVKFGEYMDQYSMWDFISPSLHTTKFDEYGLLSMQEQMQIFDQTDMSQFPTEVEKVGFIYARLWHYRYNELLEAEGMTPKEAAHKVLEEAAQVAELSPAEYMSVRKYLLDDQADSQQIFYNKTVLDLIAQDQKLLESRGWGELVIPRSAYPYWPELELNDNAMYVAKTLHDAGYTSYLVGGTVRDFVVGKKPVDFDFSTDAPYEVCQQLFGDAFSIHMAGDEGYGGVTLNGEHIDVSRYGLMPEEYVGMPKMPERNELTLLVDSFRRDLTFNALYYDPFTKELLDFHGGLNDILNKRMRSCGIPSIQYAQDAIKIVRALRLSARLGLQMDEAMDREIRKNGNKYVHNFPTNVYTYNVTMYFDAGYAVECGKNLTRYNAWWFVSPSLDHTSDPEAAIQYMTDQLPIFDKTDMSKFASADLKKGFIFSTLWRYRYNELLKSGMSKTEAADQVLAEHAPVVALSLNEYKAIFNGLIS